MTDHKARTPFRLPAIVARIGRSLPQWPHSVALCTALNAAAVMRLLPDDQLSLLEGRVFAVEVLDAGSRATFTCRGRLFRPIHGSTTTDLVFRAESSAFLKLLRREEDPDTLFFRRELSIEGDTELSLIVKNMLDALDLPRFDDLKDLVKPDKPHTPKDAAHSGNTMAAASSPASSRLH